MRVLKAENPQYPTRMLCRLFVESLEQIQHSQPPEGVHPRIWRAEQEALQSQLEELNDNVSAYERLKSGTVRSEDSS